MRFLLVYLRGKHHCVAKKFNMREFVNPREHDKLVQEALCIYVHFLVR